MKDLQGLPTTAVDVNNSIKVLVRQPEICVVPVATETLEVTVTVAMGSNLQIQL